VTRDEWKRVKAIASEAWERQPGERTAYIASACGPDDALAREVESLVAAMAAAADRFEEPPPLPADAAAALTDLTGRRVAAYEVLSRAGAGGMGEVYKARDTRLNRVVAIKVLPPGATTDGAARDRIEREARAVAALNHPNICTLHDIGRDGGLDFLVMEYVEGETLAARLTSGALPIDEALHYAAQTAAALRAAHAVGIIHRDVKPANIMLERGGGGRSPGVATVKLLDFGIAKEIRSDDSPAPAVSAAVGDLTLPGLVPGTASYMAPEQIDGAPADTRTDVFAFGAVLFEMLTGRRAFDASDRTQMADAIRDREAPRLADHGRGMPAPLDRIVAKCLARRPGDRYQSVDELIPDLQALQRRRASSARRRVLVSLGAVMLLAVGIAVWVVLTGPRSAASEPTTVVRLAASAGVMGAPALSPDGSRVAFSWFGDGVANPELVVLPIGSQTRDVLTHDPGLEEWPAWSPDGRRIAFIRCGDGKCGIYALPANGGSEQKLRDLAADRYYGLAWSPDGRFIAYGERPSPAHPFSVFLLSAESLTSRRLTAPPDGNAGDLRFAFSPDGRTLGVIRLSDSIAVHLISVDSGADTTLLTGQHEWVGGIAWSGDARHLILSANQQGVRRLWRLSIAGGGLQQVAAAGEDSYHPSVSGAAGRLAFVHQFSDWDLARAAILDGQVHAASPFPSSTRADLDPALSPDLRRVAFVSERGGTRELWVSDADGAGARQLTRMGGAYDVGRPSWSPDGTWLAFHARGIHVISADGGPPRKVVDGGETPSWSRDGQWLYYIGLKDGGYRPLKVRADGGTPVEAFPDEASAVQEASNGDLYFSSPKGGIWRSTSGAGQQPIIPEFDWTLPAYWRVLDDGIYYVVRETRGDDSVANRLKFFEFATERTTEIGLLDGTIEPWVGGLTVSRDRRTVVYSKVAYQASEVMLLDHFR
jgi:eukaryotic-like serine/threonine-protein kinase